VVSCPTPIRARLYDSIIDTVGDTLSIRIIHWLRPASRCNVKAEFFILAASSR